VRQLNLPAFDRRLDPTFDQPVAVAVSGGGDSTYALAATADWARAHGRPVIALGVDHRLQAASAAWLDAAEATAVGLGAAFIRLAWVGEKPATGLAAAARRARHALVAEAARTAGASVVVFGHTADDRAEAALMRGWGLRVGDPREWAPSPVWPEGRGVFVLRPLLSLRRAAIREALTARGLGWIEDPANEDPRQPRARARRALGAAGRLPSSTACADDAAPLARAATVQAASIRLERAAFATGAAGRALGAALLCVGGGERPPRGEKLAALLDRVAGGASFTATLAGAKLVAGGDVLIVRNAGEVARGGLASAPLDVGRPIVWDGRFALSATRPGLSVAPMRGLASRLAKAQLGALAAIPAVARPALPVIVAHDGAVTCPILAGNAEVEAVDLTVGRFFAASGAVSKEPRA